MADPTRRCRRRARCLTLTVATLALGTLAACSETSGAERTAESAPPATRALAEQRTAALQDRIVDTFPKGSVAEQSVRGWVLLSCSDDDIQTAGGVHVTLARSVDVDETYDAIVNAVEPDGYSGARDTTPRGRRA